MIQQRVTLTPEAHLIIAQAQQQLGLARFEDALGYFVEGAAQAMSVATVRTRMEAGRVRVRRKLSKGRA